MKSKFALFVMLLCTTFSLSAHIYILGYPKSGNNLFCFALSNILNESVLLSKPSGLPEVWFTPTPLDPSADLSSLQPNSIYSILFSHNPVSLKLKQANQDRDYLIVLVRNYRESIIRLATQTEEARKTFTPEKALSLIQNLQPLSTMSDCYQVNNGENYINVLRCYDNWNPKTRILVYYEDLLTDFESTMADCLMKLGVQECAFDEFIAHKEERFKQCRDSYRYGKTMSGGDLAYHQKTWLTPELSKQMDLFMQQKFPYYWNQYLQRYATP